jgi:hypothetical protein
MTALSPAREALPAAPENKPETLSSPPVGLLHEFLAKAAWALGTRAQVLQHFADLGDAPGCHYVSKQITAEAKAIASVVTMLLIAEHEHEEKQGSASPTEGGV